MLTTTKTQQTDFLGKGWSFPPTFNKSMKTVEITEKEVDIDRSLQILLNTTAGERVMEPKYGCNLEELLFEPLNQTIKSLIIDKIKTAILLFEPRIKVESIVMNAQNEIEGELLIEIVYIVKATNSRLNFVYPFYKNEGTDINFLTSTSNAL